MPDFHLLFLREVNGGTAPTLVCSLSAVFLNVTSQTKWIIVAFVHILWPQGTLPRAIGVMVFAISSPTVWGAYWDAIALALYTPCLMPNTPVLVASTLAAVFLLLCSDMT